MPLLYKTVWIRYKLIMEIWKSIELTCLKRKLGSGSLSNRLGSVLTTSSSQLLNTLLSKPKQSKDRSANSMWVKENPESNRLVP